jgi:hypothetical protein
MADGREFYGLELFVQILTGSGRDSGTTCSTTGECPNMSQPSPSVPSPLGLHLAQREGCGHGLHLRSTIISAIGWGSQGIWQFTVDILDIYIYWILKSPEILTLLIQDFVMFA